MKKKIEKIIKNNTFINKAFYLIGSTIFKIIGFFVPKKSKTILFVSYMGANYNDSPKLIYEEIIKDDYFKDFTFIWAFQDPQKYNFENQNTIKVKIDTLKYFLVALSSEFWITNVNIERGLHFKRKFTTYINTWHGVPIKKIGNDVKGRTDFNFSNVDYFCYSSDYELPIYKRAFKLDENNLKKVGMPRNEFKNINKQSILTKLNKKYNITTNKKIILYAPTWREEYDILNNIDFKVWKKQLAKKYIILLKSHNLSKNKESSIKDFVYNVSDYENIDELMVVSDLLITDYSSVVFDYTFLNKPYLLYVPDYKKYDKDRGLYLDLYKMTDCIFDNEKDLVDYLNLEDLRRCQSKKTFNKLSFIVDKPTNKIIDFIKTKTI